MAATAWYRVISHTPIPFNFGNGTVISLPYGAMFEAEPTLGDVRRYQTRFMPPKVVPIGAPTADQRANNIVIKKPGPSLPIPGEQLEAKKAPLPAGIHDVVKLTKPTK